MTLAAFPAELSVHMRESLALRDGETRRLFQPEAAPLAPRSRYSSAAQSFTITLVLDRNELAIFDNFFAVTVRQGALPFLMADPYTDGWALLDADGEPFLTAEGEPILLAATWVCLFGGGLPERRNMGGYFTVSFTLAVMP